MTRTMLMASTAKVAPRTVTVKVWRGTLTDADLTAAGFTGAPDGWEIIKGLLKLKGLPDAYLAEGVPFKATPIEGGLLMEFGGAAQKRVKH